MSKKKDKKDKKKNKHQTVGNGDSPIVIADSSTDGRPKVATSVVCISHPHFHGAVEVTVYDPGYRPALVQPPQPGMAIPLIAPWILTVNNSVHISSVDGSKVHVHFNSVTYDVGVFGTSPAFVIGGTLDSVTLLNDVQPNANLTNLQVYQGGQSGAMVQILFEPVNSKEKKKHKK
jgi:hypothetical protein